MNILSLKKKKDAKTKTYDAQKCLVIHNNNKKTFY